MGISQGLTTLLICKWLIVSGLVSGNALRRVLDETFVVETYTEHALEEKSTSKAASYVGVVKDGKMYWGAGVHSDIMTSSLNALISAINKMLAER